MLKQKDLIYLEEKGIDQEQIVNQLNNFKKGFDFVNLVKPALVGDGINIITKGDEARFIDLYDEASKRLDIVKMVPASGSASRMFKDLFSFMENYKGSYSEYLNLVQKRGENSIYDFFENIVDAPFYYRLKEVMFNDNKSLSTFLEKKNYTQIIEYILTKRKGLNYADTPKGLVDFHVYRDFVRTAFDEQLAEGAMYCNNGEVSKIHFTISEKYDKLFNTRLKKVSKVFEKQFGIKYDVSFSYQEPSTDTISVDSTNELVRDNDGNILLRPGGHGALINNMNKLDADIVFVKNIDNVAPDRKKADTIKYKKILAGVLLDVQKEVFEDLNMLENFDISDEKLNEIFEFIRLLITTEPSKEVAISKSEKIEYYKNILNRPLRVCGMVRNEGEPGGGPFWANLPDGTEKLMIVESAQIDIKNPEQAAIVKASTHFNPVDLVCGIKDYKGNKFNLIDFVCKEQGFLSTKSYMGKEIRVQELPGLWNGAMANWNTIFVEVPLSTFTPVKTVFDLFRMEHRNVIKNG